MDKEKRIEERIYQDNKGKYKRLVLIESSNVDQSNTEFFLYKYKEDNYTWILEEKIKVKNKDKGKALLNLEYKYDSY